MAGPLRRRIFQLVAATCAFMFGVLSLALLDLVAGIIPAGRESATSTALGDLAYGVIGVVFIAPAFASQVRRGTDAAALHQVALVVVALVAASVWSGEAAGVLGAAGVLVPLATVWALHPDRGNLIVRPSWSFSRRLMLGCALTISVPAWWYAGVLAARGRADLAPKDSFAFVPSLWSAVVAMLLATSLLALLAASRESGWTLSAGCVAVAALLFGLASIVNPDAPASGGRGGGLAAIAWSGGWLMAARLSRFSALRREAPRKTA